MSGTIRVPHSLTLTCDTDNSQSNPLNLYSTAKRLTVEGDLSCVRGDACGADLLEGPFCVIELHDVIETSNVHFKNIIKYILDIIKTGIYSYL